MHRQGLNSNESLPDELLIHEQTLLEIFGLLLNSKSCKTVRVKVEKMKQRSLAVGPNSSHISRTLQVTQIRAAETSDRASHWAGRSPVTHPNTPILWPPNQELGSVNSANGKITQKVPGPFQKSPTFPPLLLILFKHKHTELWSRPGTWWGACLRVHTHRDHVRKKKQWTQRDDMLCTRFTNPTSTFPSLVAHLLNCLLNEKQKDRLRRNICVCQFLALQSDPPLFHTQSTWKYWLCWEASLD